MVLGSQNDKDTSLQKCKLGVVLRVKFLVTSEEV